MQDHTEREFTADADNPLGLDGIEFIEYSTAKPQALGQVLEMPAVQDFYRSGGYEAGGSSPDEFARITRSTYDRWGAMVKQVGLAKE